MHRVLVTWSSGRDDKLWLDIVRCGAWCLLQHEWRARASRLDLMRSPQYVVAAAVANLQYIMHATLYGVVTKNLIVDDVTLDPKA